MTVCRPLAFDQLDHGDVVTAVVAHDLRLIGVAVADVGRGDRGRAFNHVVVGEDLAVGGQHQSGTGRFGLLVAEGGIDVHQGRIDSVSDLGRGQHVAAGRAVGTVQPGERGARADDGRDRRYRQAAAKAGTAGASAPGRQARPARSDNRGRLGNRGRPGNRGNPDSRRRPGSPGLSSRPDPGSPGPGSRPDPGRGSRPDLGSPDLGSPDLGSSGQGSSAPDSSALGSPGSQAAEAEAGRWSRSDCRSRPRCPGLATAVAAVATTGQDLAWSAGRSWCSSRSAPSVHLVDSACIP